jgi:hypothetical protein
LLLLAVIKKDEIARRHAEYFREFFTDAPDDWLRMSDDGWGAKYLFERDNLRAAIDFALGADGDATLAVALSGMSGPVWPELSLQGEGQSRLEAAAARIGPGVPEPDQAGVALAGSVVGYASPGKAVEALERAVKLYRRLNDDPRHGWRPPTRARARGDGPGRRSVNSRLSFAGSRTRACRRRSATATIFPRS